MKYKISFEIEPEEAKDQVVKLLNLLRINGVIGASRVFGIIDAVNKEEAAWSINFDGDGNHRLDNIKTEVIK